MTLRKQGTCSDCNQPLYGDDYGAAGHKCTKSKPELEKAAKEGALASANDILRIWEDDEYPTFDILQVRGYIERTHIRGFREGSKYGAIHQDPISRADERAKMIKEILEIVSDPIIGCPMPKASLKLLLTKLQQPEVNS